MSFFKMFPKVDYDINRTGTVQRMVDIYKSIRPIEAFTDNPSMYQLYQIPNGERPDIVSQRLYGTSEYYWTFFVVNEFLHDGYKVWPMSEEMLFDYIKQEYNGYAITTNPKIERNTDQLITDFKNSIAGRFTIGETIRGSVSGAEGTLTKKYVDMNQLIIQNVTNGPYTGNGPDDNDNYEDLIGLESTDIVESFKVYQYSEAPHHFYILDEYGNERQYSNLEFITNPYQTDGNLTITNSYEAGFRSANVLSDEINIPVTEPLATPVNELKYKSNRQYINQLNDERSKIRVINPQFIELFIDEFEKLLNE